ncbi:MAG: C39 family peptidase [Patescibacteria group bacterium]
MSYFKKISAAGFIILVVVFGSWYQFREKEKVADNIRSGKEEAIFQEMSEPETRKNESATEPQEANIANKKELPESILIKVPFLVQAPFAVWDPLHEDACEEASLIMVKHFLDKEESISSMAGDVEIRKLVRYEEQNGYGLSITMEQLAQIAKDYYKMENPRVEKNITVQDIKKELASGRPVIVPAAGKILPNPYFRGGGPVYHMLVVIGYDKNGFITNDPGTRKGEDFHYSFNDLYNAIHDWDKNNILNGQKTYLVFD